MFGGGGGSGGGGAAAVDDAVFQRQYCILWWKYAVERDDLNHSHKNWPIEEPKVVGVRAHLYTRWHGLI